MPNKRDWTGQTQGDLTIVTESGRDKFGNVLWLCRCACGAKVHKSNNALINGVRSCGTACGVAASNKRRARHNMWKSKEYASWMSLRRRCSNPTNKAYATYGGRGIKVHAAWDTPEGFDAFYAYMGPAPEGRRVSVDRIDSNGHYEPGNVRWATPKVQANNRRTNVRTMFRNELRSLSEIADLTGELYQRVFQRFRRGLLGEQLVTPQKLGRPPRKPDI